MIVQSLPQTGQSSKETQTKFVPGKITRQNRLKKYENMTFSYQSFVVKPLFFSLSNDRFDGLLIVNSFQCESIFQKQNCHHASLSLDVSKTITSLSASAERSQISQN